MWDRAIGVVVTAHNVEHKLQRQILGLMEALADLAGDFEVLIVDDGSLDDTLSVARELARQFPQIQVLHRPMRYGEMAAVRSARLLTRCETLVTYNATEAPERFRLLHLNLFDTSPGLVAQHSPRPHGRRRVPRVAELLRVDGHAGASGDSRGPHLYTNAIVDGGARDAAAQRDAYFAAEQSLYDHFRELTRGPLLVD